MPYNRIDFQGPPSEPGKGCRCFLKRGNLKYILPNSNYELQFNFQYVVAQCVHVISRTYSMRTNINIIYLKYITVSNECLYLVVNLSRVNLSFKRWDLRSGDLIF